MRHTASCIGCLFLYRTTQALWARLSIIGASAFYVANQAAGVYVLLPASARFDTAPAGMIGVTGWILPLAFIAVLALTRRLPVRNPPDLAQPDDAAEAAPAAIAAQAAAGSEIGAATHQPQV